MTFDEVPLVDYESEVFSECGAWKNFHDLEDSLCLDELMQLYETSIERQNRIIKTLAGAMGATFEEEPSSVPMSSDAPRKYTLETADDLKNLPINIGVATIEATE